MGDINGEEEVEADVLKKVGDDPSLVLCWELLNKGLDDLGAVDNDDNSADGGEGGWVLDL